MTLFIRNINRHTEYSLIQGIYMSQQSLVFDTKENNE